MGSASIIKERGLSPSWLLAALLVSCGTPISRPNVPPFSGEGTESWLVEVTEPIDRDDILEAFEASAQGYGCRTEQLGLESTSNIHGEMRRYYGVTAWCSSGTIALITLVGGRVSIGCVKPTTHQACQGLLHRISQAR
jgi:hypothetical protein